MSKQNPLTATEYCLLKMALGVGRADGSSIAQNDWCRAENLAVRSQLHEPALAIDRLVGRGLFETETVSGTRMVRCTESGKPEVLRAESDPQTGVQREILTRLASAFIDYTKPTDMYSVGTSVGLDSVCTLALFEALQKLQLIRVDGRNTYLTPKGKELAEKLTTPSGGVVCLPFGIQWKWKNGLEEALNRFWVVVLIAVASYVGGLSTKPLVHRLDQWMSNTPPSNSLPPSTTAPNSKP